MTMMLVVLHRKDDVEVIQQVFNDVVLFSTLVSFSFVGVLSLLASSRSPDGDSANYGTS